MQEKNYIFLNNETFHEILQNQLKCVDEKIHVKAKIMMWDSNSSDLNINIAHLTKKTKSHVHIRAVLRDEAQLKIIGNIHVIKDVFECDAVFDAKVLILGDKAKALVIPELRIDNNNVKASHAVVIKRLNAQDINFLVNRGINATLAKEMLVKAFLES